MPKCPVLVQSHACPDGACPQDLVAYLCLTPVLGSAEPRGLTVLTCTSYGVLNKILKLSIAGRHDVDNMARPKAASEDPDLAKVSCTCRSPAITARPAEIRSRHERDPSSGPSKVHSSGEAFVLRLFAKYLVPSVSPA